MFETFRLFYTTVYLNFKYRLNKKKLTQIIL